MPRVLRSGGHAVEIDRKRPPHAAQALAWWTVFSAHFCLGDIARGEGGGGDSGGGGGGGGSGDSPRYIDEWASPERRYLKPDTGCRCEGPADELPADRTEVDESGERPGRGLPSSRHLVTRHALRTRGAALNRAIFFDNYWIFTYWLLRGG